MTDIQPPPYTGTGESSSPTDLENGIYRADTKLTITVEKMAIQLHISRATAYALARKKEFYPAFRLGHRWIISVPALTRWLDEKTAR